MGCVTLVLVISLIGLSKCNDLESSTVLPVYKKGGIYVGTEVPNGKCPENSHFEECGADCFPTCAMLYNDMNKPCEGSCFMGCFCDAGYIYDEKALKCVRHSDCIRFECERTEVYKTCSSDCGKICHGGDMAGCENMCEVGCFCRDGFYRNPITGKCVTLEECKKIPCGENKEYNECGSKCPETCENWADLHQKFMCPKECQRGCFCKDGYVQESETSKKCIRKEECPYPPKCGDLEVFSKTGSDCRTCYNYKSIKTCVPKAEPGCYCLPEHFRDGKQKCYPLSLCEDSKCFWADPNSIYLECASGRKTCQRQTTVLTPPTCKPGCECKDGFIKDEISEKCVSMEECENILEEVKKEDESDVKHTEL